ncbi:MAG: recombinase A [Planctomycetes bacterium]|nr:recombinase A [Planctomycetota bacterium]MBI3845135.1 recombinase A [Planctomycetota bacterium]
MSAGALPRPRASLRDLLATRRVLRGLVHREAPSAWRLATFRGRLAEISGGRASATLTLAFRLVLDAQKVGEPVAWIGTTSSAFYPPDVADGGVDLAALVVVRVPEVCVIPRAAERLLRSGAFGLVLLDLGGRARLSLAAQTRLASLALAHDAALLCLTEKDADRQSQGSLVSLRAEAVRRANENAGDYERNRFSCEARVQKDKRRAPGWTHRENFRGPDGLR